MVNEKLSLLLRSTAVVIDDDIDSKESSISKLITKLEAEGILFVKLKDVRDDIDSFSNVSFIILDWKLEQPDSTLGLFGSALTSFYRERVVEFIKKITRTFYIPILIFSAENVDLIKEQLNNADALKHALETGQIGVYNKTDLLSKNVKKQLNLWLEHNQSAQLFKHLDRIIKSTEHKFFNEFDLCNPRWPNFVYNTIAEDKPVDINGEFQEFLLSSFSSRIQTEKFDGKFSKRCKLLPQDILKIYSSIKFLSYDANLPDGAYCGDIYRGELPKNQDKYIINITAACDIRKGKCLIIKGNCVSTKNFDKIDKVSEHTIFHINNHDSIVFNFNNYERQKLKNINEIIVSEIKYKRIGRLLHPYITNLQDRFSMFLIRRGSTKNPKYYK